MANDERKSGGHGNLTLYIVVAIIAAVVCALVFPATSTKLRVGGEVFLRLLQMVVVPLVMASVMSGILGLGDVRKLGRPGGFAVIYYLSTTVMAVVTGLVVVNLVNPGVGIDKSLVEDARREGAEAIEEAKSSDSQGRKITWTRMFGEDQLLLDRKSSDAKSNIMKVPADREMLLTVSVEQAGEATEPAQVRVLWSAKARSDTSADEDDNPDGPAESKQDKDFQLLEWKVGSKMADAFVSGTEPDVYSGSVELPPEARRIIVDYTAQVGGTSSTLSAQLERGPSTIADIFENLVLMLFTNNLLNSMVNMNLLPIIIFSIVFAGMLTTMGKRSEAIATLVISINDALMSFILLLMKLAPIGIFCLVAARFGKAQLEGQLVSLIVVQAKYMITVLVGLAVHALITIPLILWIFTRRNPLTFLRQMSQAVMTAFSTASSTATLPVTMECAEMKAGVSKRSTEFVLPLGATINMDGTALYEAAAAIFIAQAYAEVRPEFALTFVQQITIAVTATLSAIGAAGIPEAGLVTMLIVLNAVGLPLELIGLILPVDWLLDRFRTAVNTFGDAVGAAVIDKSFPDD